MIYVTHDQVETMTLADRIAVLNGGYLQQLGTPQELYDHPVNRFYPWIYRFSFHVFLGTRRKR